LRKHHIKRGAVLCSSKIFGNHPKILLIDGIFVM
jgi:hypothetical protein